MAGSLIGCIAKAGELFDPADKAAVLERVKELRSEGIKGAEAGRRAIAEHLAEVADVLESRERAIAIKPRRSDAELGERIAKTTSNFEGARRRYAKLEDSEGGKVLNTDVARELSADYLADRTRSAAVHEPASTFIKALYAAKLKEQPKGDELPLVLFTAGGTGAGKTSAIKALPEVSKIKDEAQIVYDTNMNTFDSAVTKIDQALEAGKKVRIVLVVRDPVDALVNGALTRAEGQAEKYGTGRTVPIKDHVETHTGAMETIPQLAEHYAGDPRVQIKVIDNTQGRGKQAERDLPWLKTLQYNDVEQLAKAALESEREAGRISAETYQGFAGRQPDSSAAQEAGRVRQETGPGVRGGAEEGNRQEVAPQPGEGREAEVLTERGQAVRVKFRLTEAADLVTSHDDALKANPDFPKELQPRDRERAASADQIRRIETNIRPALLGDSAKASDGAPIIGPDAVVESGNARTIALRRAYQSEKADAYRAWLEQHAVEFGLLPEQVRTMREPVLVRERLDAVDRAEFARQANEGTLAAMSVTEVARSDAARLSDLSGLETNEDGSINTGRSAEFIQRFMREAVGPNEAGAVMQKSGELSAGGLQRVRNAIFARAYGDAEVVAMLTESTDANVRNILAGMLRAAPELAKLRDLQDSGARASADLATPLVQAVRLFSQLRREGRTVEQFLQQGSMFDGGHPPEIESLLRGLEERSRAPRRVAEMIEGMVADIDSLGDPRQMGMFGAAVDQGAITAKVAERVLAQGRATDELGGDEAPPKPGESFIVYRLGTTGEIAGRNAGNADAVARFIMGVQDGLGPTSSEARTVFAYEVKVDAPFGSYEGMRGGASERGGHASAAVGRATRGGTDEVAYSFPAAGYTAKPIGSISLEQLNAKLKERGYEDFDDSGTNVGADVIRQAFAPTLAQADRGQIHLTDFGNKPSVIALLKNADLSTFLHESGHFYLEVYSDVASRGGQKAIADDMQKVLDWFGVKDVATWRALPFEQQRAYHEQFARGFETYLLEGKAPSVELRPMFARFRSWLLNIYRSVRALGAEITPEVRGVFDRMLASEDAIREAEAQRRYEPLFRSAADAGMTDKEFADYLAIGQQASDQALDTMQARSVRDMKWLSGAKSRALRELQGKADAERKAIAEQVTAEVDAAPAMRAKAALDALEKQHQADPLAADMNADLVAHANGFDSIDAAHYAIEQFGDRDARIAAEIDQRMLQLHGDLTDPKAIEDAANEAVHNEARARFVATGLKALTKSPLPAKMIAAAAKAAAETAIARKRVRDLDPYTYLRAESRANKDALAAAAKKPAEAIEAQRAALLNNRLARASLDARADVEKGVAYLKKAEQAKIDPEYADQIGALLERFELGGTLKRADQMTSLAKWVEAQREIGIEPEIPPEIMAEANRTNYRNLTVEEFRGLVDTVKQIEHLGRLKKKLLTAKDGREFAAARDDMLASIEANAGGRSVDVRSSNTVLGQSWERVKGFWASHIKAATWARIADGGKDGGVMWERIIRPANEAGDRETVMRAKATNDLMALVAPVLKEGGLGGKGKFFATIGRSLNREARLAWALNTGNEGNLQRLLDGNGITREQAQPVLDSLTASDWRFVQSVWDYFETYRPEIAAKERRITGKEPDWVEPVAQTVRTADGQMVELRGGYFPIKYDPRASARAEQFANAEDIAQQMQGAFTSATTRRSFTKTRAGEVKGRPLMESLDGIYGGVQEVIHDLAWHETLIDANRLLKDEQVAAMIRSTYGPEAHQQLKNWLQDVAVGEGAARKAGEDALAWVRQGVSVAGLGFNVMTALIQPLGLTQSMVRIGPQFVGRGLAKAMGSPIETTREISAMSDFMANRFLTRNRELNELRNTVKGQTKVRRAIDTTAYALMLRAQQLVDIPTWWGAYEKAMHEGNDSARAAALADQSVIDSQGSGMLKDQSAIERGGPALKLFTTFYAFFNTAFNVGAQRTMNAESKARLAADYLLLYTVPAILGAAMKDALTPGDSENWDDPDKLARKLVGEQLGYLFGLMFGLREIGSPMSNMIKGEGFGTDYQGPAGLRLLGDALKAGKQIEQGEFDDALRKAVVNLAGDLLRLPSAQINRSVTGTQALIEGKTDNPAAALFGYQEPH